MSKQTRVFNPIYSFLPTEVEGFDSLAELAWIYAGPGITMPTKSGGSLIQTVGDHSAA